MAKKLSDFKEEYLIQGRGKAEVAPVTRKWLIVDDEELSRVALRATVRELITDPGLVLLEASNVTKAVEVIQQQRPELVFLDIEMPGQKGIELISYFPRITFDFIFVTAYHEYALEAFRRNAVDYILKPIDSEEMKRALSRFKRRKKLQGKGKNYRMFKETLRSYQEKSLAIPNQTGFEMVAHSDIIRIESSGSYCTVITARQQVAVCKNLKYFEQLLPAKQFLRVHDSHIINRDHLKKYIRGAGGFVVMSDGSTVTVSKRRKEEFLKEIMGL
jgi:two-component system, LytTR family, response regulator